MLLDTQTELKILEEQRKQNPPQDKQEPPRPHHSGTGTRARLNTAAEKLFFGSKFSK